MELDKVFLNAYAEASTKTRKKGFQIILPTNVVIVFLVQCSQGSKEQTGYYQIPKKKSYIALLLTASGGRQ